MQTSEFEYYLISHLIGMDDRALAQQIELLIWAKTANPNEPILCAFLKALEESDDPTEFDKWARDYVSRAPVEWSIQGQPEVWPHVVVGVNFHPK